MKKPLCMAYFCFFVSLCLNAQTNTFPTSGNVGIGTTNPNATLQVGNSDSTGTPEQEVEIKRLSLAPVTHSGSDWFFTVRDNTYANLDIGYLNKKTITIRHDGYVGIGETSPDSKLTVRGDIHTNEIKVDLLGAVAPDYVFHKDYDLKSLEVVEDYIKINGHLPNIPSAKDMEMKGILLKEMNLKLLEKIEELTLYAISQEKKLEKVERLEEEIQNQKTNNKDLLGKFNLQETRLQNIEAFLNSKK